MEKMGSTDLFNHNVRVKQEPYDELLDEYYYKMIDIKPDVKNIQFLGENSMLQKRNDNQKTELDEIEMEFECVDVKLTVDLLINKKSDDYSRNYLQITKCSNDYQIQNKIKKETADEVKKEVNLNFDCELDEENEKRNDTEKLKDSLKIHSKKLRNGTTHSCNTCGKTFTRLDVLKRYIKSVHDKIIHKCVICGKKFSDKCTLKKHIDVAHNGVRHAGNVCGK
ncbi:GDNF-inducible zinc finger protein 1-like [Trichogramma pretiosum]|uniref:GDNF-inducible zinc finger protein 1-like n=1 Tax=Trichogramma pretiosum TaxID=7493 RepID=UPI000C719C54|nr:GDNF-inducible zinc finger protein 1-like [Trichogramma pretiosum]